MDAPYTPHLFLLTRPSRGATHCNGIIIQNRSFLLTRPSRGATAGSLLKRTQRNISTHTPLAGRDWPAAIDMIFDAFLLTRPSRGATQAP